MDSLPGPMPFAIDEEYRTVLLDCHGHYRQAAVETVREHPGSFAGTPAEFVDRMLDLHRGLVLKVFLEVAHVDWKWSKEECRLGQVLLEHLWGKRLPPGQVREALQQLLEQNALPWATLLGPFHRYPPFRVRAGALETDVLRMANLVAKADGRVLPEEVRQLKWIQAELERLLQPVPMVELAAPAPDVLIEEPFGPMKTQRQNQAPSVDGGSTSTPTMTPTTTRAGDENALVEALTELDHLIGLDAIKHEVRTLINFLKVQEERRRFGLPTTPISLHAVFTGNPGTGKTTVARLVGRLLGAIGFVSKGHLIETDRSGLVAEYAGQTGPKTNKRIDEALGGILFIDEAYSLATDRGDDAYGAEALQALLKRMEDERHRLVVVLAGYPGPMTRLLRSNPGLSSRFSRTFQFPDYTASELGCIFESFCRDQRYELPLEARVKLLLSFKYLIDRRDEHFGNGRLARNVFERTIGRMANRIAAIVPLTHELLTVLATEDIDVDGVPQEVWTPLDSPSRQFQVCCPRCRRCSRAPQSFLLRKLRCKQCEIEFTPGWGEPLVGG